LLTAGDVTLSLGGVGKRVRRTACYDVGVPVWFLFVGIVGTLYPPSTPAVALSAFVTALLIVPGVALAIDVCCMWWCARRNPGTRAVPSAGHQLIVP